MKPKHPIEKIKFGVIPIVNYRGISVEKILGGYRVFGKTATTGEEVDEIIDNACSILSETIVNPNDGSMNVQNVEDEN